MDCGGIWDSATMILCCTWSIASWICVGSASSCSSSGVSSTSLQLLDLNELPCVDCDDLTIRWEAAPEVLRPLTLEIAVTCDSWGIACPWVLILALFFLSALGDTGPWVDGWAAELKGRGRFCVGRAPHDA